MYVYKTRYQAEKDRKANERIVKVDGGYVLMDYKYYEIWRNQK